MDPSGTEPRRVEKVALACIQCRGRHVKCDAIQPVCGRCRRDGKECTYMKSRRGGLDKAALARRRAMLQQPAENPEAPIETVDFPSSTEPPSQSASFDHITTLSLEPLPHSTLTSNPSDSVVFAVNTDRLIDLFYENFWPAFPITLPRHHLSLRLLSENHGLEHLLLVMQFIGSVYAPWTAFEPYYKASYRDLQQPGLSRTLFNIQALLLMAIAQHHCDYRSEANAILSNAVQMGMEMQIQTKGFARTYGEGNPVLEESCRRTFYFLHLTDHHCAVVTNNPLFKMRDIVHDVDLPCDDEYYESGRIPTPATWQEYDQRDFADVEVIYSSITYLFDIERIVCYIMRVFMNTGTFSSSLVSSVDTKLAVWRSLLPETKKNPIKRDGAIDEVMFMAHSVHSVVTMNCHRPMSSLTYSVEELSADTFVTPVPFLDPSRQGRATHTARALRAADEHTKLLAIQCVPERHHLFTLGISATLAVAQISACNLFLEDHAMDLARDRIRLTIGYLSQMGTVWPLAKRMAKEVRYIARQTMLTAQVANTTQPDPNAITEIPRDELIWPLDSSAAQIDIYSGIVIPVNWDPALSYSSPSSSSRTA